MNVAYVRYMDSSITINDEDLITKGDFAGHESLSYHQWAVYFIVFVWRVYQVYEDYLQPYGGVCRAVHQAVVYGRQFRAYGAWIVMLLSIRVRATSRRRIVGPNTVQPWHYMMAPARVRRGRG